MGEWEVPDARGSLVFEIKNYLSCVLFALVDANCKFLLVDVGAYEKAQRGGDAGMFHKSNMDKTIKEGVIPPPHLLNRHCLSTHEASLSPY